MSSSSEVLEIAGSELVQILRTPRDQYASGGGCAVLDCRPFLAFTWAHIGESRNINWNSMLRRRSKSSVVCLEWLIPDKALLGRLRRGDFSPVVVVDESSGSVASLKGGSLARMLLSALQTEIQANSVQICFLQGGFEGFSEAYPELCYNSGNNLAAVDPEPTVTGRRTPAYDQGGPVELLPFLFLGSAVHSSRRETLAAAGITAVLNVSSSCPNLYEEELLYLRLTVEDSLAADIRACFSEAIDFIDSVKAHGGRVLVHCQAGISRSATICLAYLMHTQRVRLEEAFDFVKQRRQVISPNLAFMGQLLQFETDVLCQG
ncbi:dual specificity protein phosphatase 2 [Diretmus argenteus]